VQQIDDSKIAMPALIMQKVLKFTENVEWRVGSGGWTEKCKVIFDND